MLCRSLPRNANGADPFRPLRGRRLHQAERLGSAPFIMAAPILSYEGLGLVQGSGWLFQDLAIYVGARDRLPLIRRNGAGTTTLLTLLAGQIAADRGPRVIVPGQPEASSRGKDGVRKRKT